MLGSRVWAMVNRQLKYRQPFNIMSTTAINPELPSAQKQDSSKTENQQQQQQQQQQPRKLGAWVAIALTTGAAGYYFYSNRRPKGPPCFAAWRIRPDLPNFSSKDVIERQLYVYGVGVYDLNDYAKTRHPGGEATIKNTVGGSFDKIFESDAMKFHKRKETLKLLESMRVGNVDGAVEKEWSCHKSKVVPKINAKEYRLELAIDDGRRVKALSLEELRRYPKHSIVSSIPWKPFWIKKEGPTWTGVQLRDILRELKINETDYDAIRFECLDASSITDKPCGSSVPIDRVLNEPNFDVLLAYDKNGSEISPHHGFPVRVVMPQATGTKKVKWLHRVVLVKKAD